MNSSAQLLKVKALTLYTPALTSLLQALPPQRCDGMEHYQALEQSCSRDNGSFRGEGLQGSG